MDAMQKALYFGTAERYIIKYMSHKRIEYDVIAQQSNHFSYKLFHIMPKESEMYLVVSKVHFKLEKFM